MTINVSEAIDFDTAVIVSLIDTINGEYVNGIYVPGAENITKALASAQQPTPKQLEFLEGSERTKNVKAFYLNKAVYLSEDDRISTIIVHRGMHYKLVHVGDWEDFGWFFAMGAKVT